jgi:DNA gyrase/topoisomerase IV subunit B
LDDLDEDLDREADIKSNLEEEAYITRRVSIDFEEKEVSALKKTFFWICGIETHLKENGLPTVEQAPQIVDTSIDQDPKWAFVCDINAIVAIALSGFIVAFFNNY